MNKINQDSILRHHFEAKIDNRSRLRQVKNLDELIHFNIKTVADRMIEEGVLVDPESQSKGLYSLRKVVDPLLINSNFPQISKNRHPNASRRGVSLQSAHKKMTLKS